jgi:hypothetical protein
MSLSLFQCFRWGSVDLVTLLVSSQKVGTHPCGRLWGQAQGRAPTLNY